MTTSEHTAARQPGPAAIHAAEAAELADVARRLRRQAADLAAAEYRWLSLLADFDRRGGWALDGAKSCAAWLGWACGMSAAAARERVRVAHALCELPLVSSRMAAGELSYAKVRAITRVATADNEELLVVYAEHATAAQLETVVRGYRRARRVSEDEQDDEDDELARHRRRGCWWWVDDEGFVRLAGRWTVTEGMRIVRVLDELADHQDEEPADETFDGPEAKRRLVASEPAQARRADALAAAAEAAATHDSDRTGDERYLVEVTVQAETLYTDRAGASPETGPPTVRPPRAPDEPAPRPDPPARVDSGGWVSSATARRLACDSRLVALVEDALGRPLGVGRSKRTVPRRLRRALGRRDRGCRFPGCSQTRHLDAHHVWFWGEGGPTEPDNLVLLCRYHHMAVHEGGFTITKPARGRFTFHRPDGSVIATVAPSPSGDVDRPAESLIAGAAPTADSLLPDLDVRPPDLGAAVSYRYRATHEPPTPSTGVSAETAATGSGGGKT